MSRSKEFRTYQSTERPWMDGFNAAFYRAFKDESSRSLSSEQFLARMGIVWGEDCIDPESVGGVIKRYRPDDIEDVYDFICGATATVPSILAEFGVEHV